MNLYLMATTKYLGPTDNKGSRIKATIGSESITRPYRADKSPSEAHALVVWDLLQKMSISVRKVKGGEIKGGYAWLIE